LKGVANTNCGQIDAKSTQSNIPPPPPPTPGRRRSCEWQSHRIVRGLVFLSWVVAVSWLLSVDAREMSKKDHEIRGAAKNFLLGWGSLRAPSNAFRESLGSKSITSSAPLVMKVSFPSGPFSNLSENSFMVGVRAAATRAFRCLAKALSSCVQGSSFPVGGRISATCRCRTGVPLREGTISHR